MNHYRDQQVCQRIWTYSLFILLSSSLVGAFAHIMHQPQMLKAQGDDTSIFLPVISSESETSPAAAGYDFSAVGEVAQRNQADLASVLSNQDIAVSRADPVTVRLSFLAAGHRTRQIDVRCSGVDCAGESVAAALVAPKLSEPNDMVEWRILLHLDTTRTLEIWQSAGNQLNMRLILSDDPGPQVVFNCGVAGECLIEIDLSDVESEVIETVTPDPDPTLTPTFTPTPASESVIFFHDFDQNSQGVYRENEWSADWWNPPWENGVDEGRARIVSDQEPSGNALEIFYPEGLYGTSDTGAQWKLGLEQSYEELYLSYRFKLGSGFDFAKGGKLPGLIGGAGNTGGGRPTGLDGWSVRMMWRANGKLTFYAYHPDQPNTYGEDLDWIDNGEPVFIEADQWYQVQHRIVMNSPAQRNGIIQGWLDGELLFEKRNMRFRDVNDFAIDTLYFSSFFGGNDPSFATTRDERIYFDDFVISSEPIDQSTQPTPTATPTPDDVDPDTPTATPTPDDVDPDTPTPTPTATPTPPSAQTIFSHNFDQNSEGLYAQNEWESDWNNASWNNGIDEGRARIVAGADMDGNALQIHYPQGEYGPSETGVQWKLRLDRSYDKVTLTHRLKFEEGFDFVRGGKLYELYGGDTDFGNQPPSGEDGWSAALLWRADGKLIFKIEYPDQPSNSAEVLPWMRDGEPLLLEGGRWYDVRQQIVMNTPGQNDGSIRGWLDGELLFEKQTMRFRDVDTLAVDTFYMNTFFGGNSDNFAAARDEYIYFDRFTFSTE